MYMPPHFAGLGRERGQLRRLGIGRGRVDQRRADAHRAVLHRLARPARACASSCAGVGWTSFSPSSCTRTVVAPTNEATLGVMPLLLQIFEILGERRPADRIFDVALPLHRERFHVRRERAHRIAFAHDFESDALRRVAQPAAVGDQALGRPAQHVDEAGRDRFAGRVHDPRRAAGRMRPDIDDLVALQRDVADEWRAARAVVDRPAADDEAVVRWRMAPRRSGGRCKQARNGNDDRNTFFHGTPLPRSGEAAPTCSRALYLSPHCRGWPDQFISSPNAHRRRRP